ncbi:nuclear transport factor 2-like protein [Phaeacidiphilus oryzae]|uniref:hypothetical protein n=1 Tax=Phaeacidiphilus oryzae TaxID=348818 RepID=UPI000AB76D48|nr:hypothetical protein [Phaeacidiphilus oryzae]
MSLRAYLASMDASDPEQTLELLEPDFRFFISVPGREHSGSSRTDFAAYIAGRNPVDRRHRVLRHSRDGDVETVYGVVTEAGKYSGSFQSSAVVAPSGRLARYQSFFTTSFELVDWDGGQGADSRPGPEPETAPFLGAWFAILDSDEPDRILDLISDDFSLSILFSTGDGGATDFAGGREALVGYLKQRERGTRTHHRLSATTLGRDEVFLGEVRRSGVPEASFVAAGRIDGEGRLQRLLIGRSSEIRFS